MSNMIFNPCLFNLRDRPLSQYRAAICPNDMTLELDNNNKCNFGGNKAFTKDHNWCKVEKIYKNTHGSGFIGAVARFSPRSAQKLYRSIGILCSTISFIEEEKKSQSRHWNTDIEAQLSVPLKVLLIVMLSSTAMCRTLKGLGRPELTLPGVVVKLDH